VTSNDLKRIKELASDNVLTSAYLIIAECGKLKARLALELQASGDDRKKQWREFRELISELRETLTQIQAQFRIEAQLLNLIGPNSAGDQKTQKEKGRGRTRTQA
jgi:hypothetical protein